MLGIYNIPTNGVRCTYIIYIHLAGMDRYMQLLFLVTLVLHQEVGLRASMDKNRATRPDMARGVSAV